MSSKDSDASSIHSVEEEVAQDPVLVYDFRLGSIPEGVECVGDGFCMEESGQFSSLVVPPGGYLKFKFDDTFKSLISGDNLSIVFDFSFPSLQSVRGRGFCALQPYGDSESTEYCLNIEDDLSISFHSHQMCSNPAVWNKEPGDSSFHRFVCGLYSAFNDTMCWSSTINGKYKDGFLLFSSESLRDFPIRVSYIRVEISSYQDIRELMRVDKNLNAYKASQLAEKNKRDQRLFFQKPFKKIFCWNSHCFFRIIEKYATSPFEGIKTNEMQHVRLDTYWIRQYLSGIHYNPSNEDMKKRISVNDILLNKILRPRDRLIMDEVLKMFDVLCKTEKITYKDQFGEGEEKRAVKDCIHRLMELQIGKAFITSIHTQDGDNGEDYSLYFIFRRIDEDNLSIDLFGLDMTAQRFNNAWHFPMSNKQAPGTLKVKRGIVLTDSVPLKKVMCESWWFFLFKAFDFEIFTQVIPMLLDKSMNDIINENYDRTDTDFHAFNISYALHSYTHLFSYICRRFGVAKDTMKLFTLGLRFHGLRVAQNDLDAVGKLSSSEVSFFNQAISHCSGALSKRLDLLKSVFDTHGDSKDQSVSTLDALFESETENVKKMIFNSMKKNKQNKNGAAEPAEKNNNNSTSEEPKINNESLNTQDNNNNGNNTNIDESNKINIDENSNTKQDVSDALMPSSSTDAEEPSAEEIELALKNMTILPVIIQPANNISSSLDTTVNSMELAMSLMSVITDVETKLNSTARQQDVGGQNFPKMETDRNVAPQFDPHVLSRFEIFKPSDVRSLIGKVQSSFTSVALDFNSMRRKVDNWEDALNLMTDCHTMCQQIMMSALVADSMRASQLVISVLCDVFLRSIPVPISTQVLETDSERKCIWNSKINTPVMTAEKQALISATLNRCVCVLIGAHSIHTDQYVYELLPILLGVMASIWDATIRRQPEEGPMLELTRVFNGIPFAIDYSTQNVGRWGSVCPMLNDLGFNTCLDIPEALCVRTEVADYFSQLNIDPKFQVLMYEEKRWTMKLEPRLNYLLLDLFSSHYKGRSRVNLSLIVGAKNEIKHYFPEFEHFLTIFTWFKISLSKSPLKWKNLVATLPSASNIIYSWDAVSKKWKLFQLENPITIDEEPRPMKSAVSPQSLWKATASSRKNVEDRPEIISEEDILQIGELPSFGDRIGQFDSELFMSYLTVPYMRLPLVINFFASQDRIHSLQSRELMSALRNILFEWGPLRPLGVDQTPSVVPTDNPNHLYTTNGALVNEILMSPKSFFQAVERLIDVTVSLDSDQPQTEVSYLIIEVIRLTLFIEQTTTFVLAYTAGKLSIYKDRVFRDLAFTDVEKRKEAEFGLLSLIAAHRCRVLPMIRRWITRLNILALETSASMDTLSQTALYLHSLKLLLFQTFSGESGAFIRDTFGNQLTNTPLTLTLSSAHEILDSFFTLSTRYDWEYGLSAICTDARLVDLMHVLRKDVVDILSSSPPAKVNKVLQSIYSIISGQETTIGSKAVLESLKMEEDEKKGLLSANGKNDVKVKKNMTPIVSVPKKKTNEKSDPLSLTDAVDTAEGVDEIEAKELREIATGVMDSTQMRWCTIGGLPNVGRFVALSVAGLSEQEQNDEKLLSQIAVIPESSNADYLAELNLQTLQANLKGKKLQAFIASKAPGTWLSFLNSESKQCIVLEKAEKRTSYYLISENCRVDVWTDDTRKVALTCERPWDVEDLAPEETWLIELIEPLIEEISKATRQPFKFYMQEDTIHPLTTVVLLQCKLASTDQNPSQHTGLVFEILVHRPSMSFSSFAPTSYGRQLLRNFIGFSNHFWSYSTLPMLESGALKSWNSRKVFESLEHVKNLTRMIEEAHQLTTISTVVVRDARVISCFEKLEIGDAGKLEDEFEGWGFGKSGGGFSAFNLGDSDSGSEVGNTFGKKKNDWITQQKKMLEEFKDDGYSLLDEGAELFMLNMGVAKGNNTSLGVAHFPKEKYLPVSLLSGYIPYCLLDKYAFFQDCQPPYHIRGYPIPQDKKNFLRRSASTEDADDVIFIRFVHKQKSYNVQGQPDVEVRIIKRSTRRQATTNEICEARDIIREAVRNEDGDRVDAEFLEYKKRLEKQYKKFRLKLDNRTGGAKKKEKGITLDDDGNFDNEEDSASKSSGSDSSSSSFTKGVGTGDDMMRDFGFGGGDDEFGELDLWSLSDEDESASSVEEPLHVIDPLNGVDAVDGKHKKKRKGIKVVANDRIRGGKANLDRYKTHAGDLLNENADMYKINDKQVGKCYDALDCGDNDNEFDYKAWKLKRKAQREESRNKKKKKDEVKEEDEAMPVTKMMIFEDCDDDLVLMNPLYAPASSPLQSIALLFTRIAPLGNILFWKKRKHVLEAAKNNDYSCVAHSIPDVIDVPNLELSFNVKFDDKDSSKFTIQSVDHSHLHLPITLPQHISNLCAGLPYSLVLATENNEFSILIPNYHFWRPNVGDEPLSGRVFPIFKKPKAISFRKEMDGKFVDMAKYYLYNVHISHNFILCSSMTSALSIMRYFVACRDYKRAFEILPAVGTDVAFSDEEILALHCIFQMTHQTVLIDPIAQALILKLHLAIMDSPTSIYASWSVFLSFIYGFYLLFITNVPSWARLTFEDERLLIDHIATMKKKRLSARSHFNRNTVITTLQAFKTQNLNEFEKLLRADNLFCTPEEAFHLADEAYRIHAEKDIRVKPGKFFKTLISIRDAHMLATVKMDAEIGDRVDRSTKNVVVPLPPVPIIMLQKAPEAEWKLELPDADLFLTCNLNQIFGSQCGDLKYDKDEKRFNDSDMKLYCDGSFDRTVVEFSPQDIFMRIYSILSGVIKVRLIRDSSIENALVFCRAMLISHLANMTKGGSPSSLALLSALLLIVNNADRVIPQLPQFKDTRKNKSVDTLSYDTSYSEPNSPFATLLQSLQEVLISINSDVPLAKSATCLPAVSEHAMARSGSSSQMTYYSKWQLPIDHRLSGRGFTRQEGPGGPGISDLACSSRTLVLPNPDIASFDAFLLKESTLPPFQESLLDMEFHGLLTKMATVKTMKDFSTKPLGDALLIAGVTASLHQQVTEVSGNVDELTDEDFPFDFKPSSVIGQSTLNRLKEGCKEFSKVSRISPELFLTCLSDVNCEKHLRYSAEKTVTIGSSAHSEILSWLQSAQNNIQKLRGCLMEMRQNDEKFVMKSIQYINKVARASFSSSKKQSTDDLRQPCDRRANIFTGIPFQMMTCLLLSTRDTSDLRSLNPCITEQMSSELLNLTVWTMLFTNRIGHVNSTLLNLKDLHKALAAVLSSINSFKNGETVIIPDGTVARLKLSSCSVATFLTAERHYMNSHFEFDPRFLVFEFTWSILLRKRQVQLVTDFRDSLMAGKSSVKQMIMGGGKTTVVGPLLCMMLADGKHLVTQVVPPALLDFSRSILRSTFSFVLFKRVITLHCDRNTPITPMMLHLIETARRRASVVVTVPAAVKSLMLKFVEAGYLVNLENAPPTIDIHYSQAEAAICSKVIGHMSDGVVIVDEVDLVLHPLKSELNFPIGGKKDLDFSPQRWKAAMHIINAFFCIDKTIRVKGIKSKGVIVPPHLADSPEAKVTLDNLQVVVRQGYESQCIQRIPHLILLNLNFYKEKMLDILAQWVLIYLRQEHVGCLPEEEDDGSGSTGDLSNDEILSFLVNRPTADSPLWARILKTSSHDRMMLNLCYEWLHIFLPHCLSKVNRVSFGIMNKEDIATALESEPNMPRSRLKLAIPFVGKDVPSPASEFAHPDVTIGLTVLAYKYDGLRWTDFHEIIAALQNRFQGELGPVSDRPTALQYAQWIHSAGASVAGLSDPLLENEIKKLKGEARVMMQIKQDEYRLKVLDDQTVGRVQPLHLLKKYDEEEMNNVYNILKSLPTLLDNFLLEFVFPTFLRYQSIKLSASGQELGGDILFARRIGFSGTPSDLVPRSLGACGFEAAVEGEMVNTLTDCSVVSTDFVREKNWSVESLLKRIATSLPSYHALIDTGALVTGMSNVDVAKYLMKEGLSHVDGVVFLDEQDRKMIISRESGHISPLAESGIPPERRFAYYDQVHTTGMDIRHTFSARAALLLGKDMTWRDYAQGAYRMRGIGKGQTITLVSIPEVTETAKRVAHMHNVIFRSEEGSQRKDLEEFMAWLVLNQLSSETLQWAMLQQQDVSNIWRKKALSVFNENSESLEDVNVKKALATFVEPVVFPIDDGLPHRDTLKQIIENLVSSNKDFIDKNGQVIVDEILSQDTNFALSAGNAVEQEKEQEQEQEKEQENQRQVEIERFMDVAYSRDNEASIRWPLTHLSKLDMPYEFIPISQFKLYSRKSLEFASETSLLFTQNYFNPDWTGARRVKNVVAVLEWIPSVSHLSMMDSMLNLSPEVQEDSLLILNKCFNLLDREKSGFLTVHMIKECIFALFGDALNPDQVMDLLCRVPGSNVPLLLLNNGINLNEMSSDAISKILIPRVDVQRLFLSTVSRKSDGPRFYLCLTLSEAETIRRVIHSRVGLNLFDDCDATVSLRLLPEGFASLDEVNLFKPAPQFAFQRCFEALRFFDCHTFYDESAVRILTGVLQSSKPILRQRFFENLIGCKRRYGRAWHSRPIAKPLTAPTEFHTMYHTILAVAVRHALLAMNISSVAEAFDLFDTAKDSFLSMDEICGSFHWLGLNLPLEDVIEFIEAGDTDGDFLLSRKDFVDMLHRKLHLLFPDPLGLNALFRQPAVFRSGPLSMSGKMSPSPNDLVKNSFHHHTPVPSPTTPFSPVDAFGADVSTVQYSAGVMAVLIDGETPVKPMHKVDLSRLRSKIVSDRRLAEEHERDKIIAEEAIMDRRLALQEEDLEINNPRSTANGGMLFDLSEGGMPRNSRIVKNAEFFPDREIKGKQFLRVGGGTGAKFTHLLSLVPNGSGGCLNNYTITLTIRNPEDVKQVGNFFTSVHDISNDANFQRKVAEVEMETAMAQALAKVKADWKAKMANGEEVPEYDDDIKIEEFLERQKKIEELMASCLSSSIEEDSIHFSNSNWQPRVWNVLTIIVSPGRRTFVLNATDITEESVKVEIDGPSSIDLVKGFILGTNSKLTRFGKVDIRDVEIHGTCLDLKTIIGMHIARGCWRVDRLLSTAILIYGLEAVANGTAALANLPPHILNPKSSYSSSDFRRDYDTGLRFNAPGSTVCRFTQLPKPKSEPRPKDDKDPQFPNVYRLTAGSFHELMTKWKESLVIVMLATTWCPACERMKPILNELALALEDANIPVCLMDPDFNSKPAEFKERFIPAMRLYFPEDSLAQNSVVRKARKTIVIPCIPELDTLLEKICDASGRQLHHEVQALRFPKFIKDCRVLPFIENTLFASLISLLPISSRMEGAVPTTVIRSSLSEVISDPGSVFGSLVEVTDIRNIPVSIMSYYAESMIAHESLKQFNSIDEFDSSKHLPFARWATVVSEVAVRFHLSLVKLNINAKHIEFAKLLNDFKSSIVSENLVVSDESAQANPTFEELKLSKQALHIVKQVILELAVVVVYLLDSLPSAEGFFEYSIRAVTSGFKLKNNLAFDAIQLPDDIKNFNGKLDSPGIPGAIRETYLIRMFPALLAAARGLAASASPSERAYQLRDAIVLIADAVRVGFMLDLSPKTFSNGVSLATAAAAADNIDMIRFLLASGAHLDTAVSNLYASAVSGTPSISNKGVSYNKLTHSQNTPLLSLEIAALLGNTESIKLLLSVHAFPGRALSFAALGGHTQVVQMLLHAGVSPVARVGPYSALEVALLEGRMGAAARMMRFIARHCTSLTSRVVKLSKKKSYSYGSSWRSISAKSVAEENFIEANGLLALVFGRLIPDKFSDYNILVSLVKSGSVSASRSIRMLLNVFPEFILYPCAAPASLAGLLDYPEVTLRRLNADALAAPAGSDEKTLKIQTLRDFLINNLEAIDMESDSEEKTSSFYVSSHIYLAPLTMVMWADDMDVLNDGWIAACNAIDEANAEREKKRKERSRKMMEKFHSKLAGYGGMGSGGMGMMMPYAGPMMGPSIGFADDFDFMDGGFGHHRSKVSTFRGLLSSELVRVAAFTRSPEMRAKLLSVECPSSETNMKLLDSSIPVFRLPRHDVLVKLSKEKILKTIPHFSVLISDPLPIESNRSFAASFLPFSFLRSSVVRDYIPGRTYADLDDALNQNGGNGFRSNKNKVIGGWQFARNPKKLHAAIFVKKGIWNDALPSNLSDEERNHIRTDPEDIFAFECKRVCRDYLEPLIMAFLLRNCSSVRSFELRDAVDDTDENMKVKEAERDGEYARRKKEAEEELKRDKQWKPQIMYEFAFKVSEGTTFANVAEEREFWQKVSHSTALNDWNRNCSYITRPAASMCRLRRNAELRRNPVNEAALRKWKRLTAIAEFTDNIYTFSTEGTETHKQFAEVYYNIRNGNLSAGIQISPLAYLRRLPIFTVGHYSKDELKEGFEDNSSTIFDAFKDLERKYTLPSGKLLALFDKLKRAASDRNLKDFISISATACANPELFVNENSVKELPTDEETEFITSLMSNIQEKLAYVKGVGAHYKPSLFVTDRESAITLLQMIINSKIEWAYSYTYDVSSIFRTAVVIYPEIISSVIYASSHGDRNVTTAFAPLVRFMKSDMRYDCYSSSQSESQTTGLAFQVLESLDDIEDLAGQIESAKPNIITSGSTFLSIGAQAVTDANYFAEDSGALRAQVWKYLRKGAAEDGLSNVFKTVDLNEYKSLVKDILCQRIPIVYKIQKAPVISKYTPKGFRYTEPSLNLSINRVSSLRNQTALRSSFPSPSNFVNLTDVTRDSKNSAVSWIASNNPIIEQVGIADLLSVKISEIIRVLKHVRDKIDAAVSFSEIINILNENKIELLIGKPLFIECTASDSYSISKARDMSNSYSDGFSNFYKRAMWWNKKPTRSVMSSIDYSLYAQQIGASDEECLLWKEDSDAQIKKIVLAVRAIAKKKNSANVPPDTDDEAEAENKDENKNENAEAENKDENKENETIVDENADKGEDAKDDADGEDSDEGEDDDADGDDSDEGEDEIVAGENPNPFKHHIFFHEYDLDAIDLFSVSSCHSYDDNDDDDYDYDDDDDYDDEN